MKIEKPEAFIIRILKEESLIEKAKIMQSIFLMQDETDKLRSNLDLWRKVKDLFLHQKPASLSNLSNRHWFNEII